MTAKSDIPVKLGEHTIFIVAGSKYRDTISHAVSYDQERNVWRVALESKSASTILVQQSGSTWCEVDDNKKM